MRVPIFLAGSLIAATLSADEPSSPAAAADPVTQRLDEIAARLDKIEKRLDEHKELMEMPEHEKMRRRHGQQFQGVNHEELRKLTLPEKPTREQARHYVSEILRITAGQNSFSSNDPQPAMFRRVGPEHLDVLIEFLRDDERSQNYLNQAVVSLATEDHKPLVLEKLVQRPALISIVEKLGWERDARDILIGGLRDRPGKLPSGWAEIVVGFNDAETYPALAEHLAKSDEPAQVYRVIADLPGIDLDEAVVRAWKRLQGGQLRGPWPAASLPPPPSPTAASTRSNT